MIKSLIFAMVLSMPMPPVRFSVAPEVHTVEYRKPLIIEVREASVTVKASTDLVDWDQCCTFSNPARLPITLTLWPTNKATIYKIERR